MKRLSGFLLGFLFLASCGEKLMEKPENLIPRDQLVLILKDMAIANAAKGVNIGILKDHDIEPTSYVFEKYGIDSTQFVESDRYYASLPVEYEAIFEEVEALLDAQKTHLEEQKKIQDSLRLLESKQKKNKVLDSIAR